MMKVLVITGGIGSGKSEVCRIMHELGITAQYNADTRVKELYHRHPTLLSSIENKLGVVLRDEEGAFLPGRLAERIFNDRSALHEVESLVFPALLEDFEEFKTARAGEDYLVFESATILEKDLFDGFGDYTVLVDAPFEERLERACLRDGTDRDAVIKRMNNQRLMNQISDGYQDPRVDFVILNDSSREDLEDKIKVLLTENL